ncbi:glycogen debranching enzyme [Geothermobacter ehrlichii]|uniref:Glycogen debranching enzyme n=1 Tax=Geothermobacter ehrlichii TaxID=213224 RepID=A0A5D3WLL4_9BACT|nr:amylo-alpha-1,6-glucosidase [Geothermobacter ehrlichii]TYO99602.1 glycogen debranching enzyme [Geothermobacter ehrlichii]
MDEIIQVRDQYYIQASSCLADDRTRVLKQGETFAVHDCRGDIQPVGRGEQGLYHQGTRFLSRLEFFVNRQRPLILSSTVNNRNELLAVDLTNPDLVLGDRQVPRGSLHLFRSKFLWNRCCFERLRLVNFAPDAVEIELCFRYAADFHDIFEVRGMRRRKHGRMESPKTGPDRVTLPYLGLDGCRRRALLQFAPRPDRLSAEEASFRLRLAPHEERSIYLTVVCLVDEEDFDLPAFDRGFDASLKRLEGYRGKNCGIETSKQHFDEWLNRSLDDLNMLLTETPQGIYPYAGVPWYSTAFGRDGLITALQTLWLNPDIARGVLAFLAANQADSHHPKQDAEPGKILHETRQGEMAALDEIPFGRYYGSVDSTPLFVLLAGAWLRRTGDLDFVRQIWPQVKKAVDWIDRYGDIDGDGLIEYHRQSADGLVQQGWKDSWDSVFHADGRLAEGPIALCEVQGYVYAARLAAAEMAEQLGEREMSDIQRNRAERLRELFLRAFWNDELGCYALALDGEKRPCLIPSSNAGQSLFTGIAAPEHAERLAERLLQPDFFSGWGIRTIAEGVARYNPMSYHNGSVWPHDNALIALGLARYGKTRQALKIFSALYDLAMQVDLQRLPELFCGFRRLPGQGPVLYPLACSPQAWAAGAVFMLLQACLGLDIDARRRTVCFRHPVLPDFLDQVTLRDLRLAGGRISLRLTRYHDDVGINILERSGKIGVTVIK